MIELLPTIIVLVIAMAIFVWLWRQGAFLKVSAYVQDTKEELKKCTWPTWDELMGSTVVVLVSVALLGAFTMGVDFVVASLVKFLV
jgi:preprotein translocase subunit SecE